MVDGPAGPGDAFDEPPFDHPSRERTEGLVTLDWTFIVTVAAQNGFGFYDARQLVPVPADDTSGGYNFAVCTAAEAAMVPEPTICTSSFEQVSGGYVTNVPYVMDTIPPTGVNVQQELDPTVGPVVIQGVTVP